MKIFICYAHTDKEIAYKLVSELENYHDCWIDSDDIRAGADWERSIDWAVARTDAFLFLASWQSVESEQCQREVSLALRLRRRIIPVVLVNPIVMRPELSRLQWIFLENFDDGVRSLCRELRPLYNYWQLLALAELFLIILMAAWMWLRIG
jgi:hypothetical protein